MKAADLQGSSTGVDGGMLTGGARLAVMTMGA